MLTLEILAKLETSTFLIFACRCQSGLGIHPSMIVARCFVAIVCAKEGTLAQSRLLTHAYMGRRRCV